MSTIQSSWIPDYIAASSPMALRRLMFITNAKSGKAFQYFDIQSFVDENGKTRWIAWFYRGQDGLGDLNDAE